MLPLMTSATPGEPAPARPRDPYVDFLRAFSLLVVVIWHWAFTILVWRSDGPHATSPLGFTRGLWLATWLLQVMPLFFFVGGYVHLRSWESAQRRGVRMWPFVRKRMRQLLVPAGTVLIAWIALGSLIGTYFDLQGYAQVVKLIVSPLWFLGVYLGLIALLPIAFWLHRKAGVLVLVWLGGGAMLVDVLRFHHGLDLVAWFNMLLVWGLAHQAGFFYQKIVDAPRHNDWALLWTGLFGLVGLVASGLYPGSMVGVPGERFSNVGPPTFVIVALLLFQIGVAELLRPRMLVMLRKPRWRRANALINNFAMPLYLVHTTGMALFLFLMLLAFGLEMNERANVDAGWWLTRPLAIAGPLLCTIPVLWVFRWVQRRTRVRRLAAIEHTKESETAIAS